MPGADLFPQGINAAGQVFGQYIDSTSGVLAGFIDTNGTIATISLPGIYPEGINAAGQVFGYYRDSTSGTLNGFIDTNGTITTISVPGADTLPLAINAAGQVVGEYQDSTSGTDNGFIDTNGTITTISVPGATDTYVEGINDAGRVFGFYKDSTGYHGFVTSIADLGPVIAATTPSVVEKTQTTVVGIVTPGLLCDTLSLTQTSNTAGGSLALQMVNGVEEVIYTAAANVPASTVDSVTYQITDENGDVVQGAASVQLDAGPTATNPNVTVALGQTIDLAGLKLAIPGLLGDRLSVASDSAATGTATVVGGDLIYTPGVGFVHLAANATAKDTVSYTVSDQYGGTTTGTLNVTVTNAATNIFGGPWGNSVIQGTAGADIITAYGWNNTIYDNGGNDVVNAGQGQATVYTGSGDVVVNLGGYNNTVTGGDGWNTVTGSQGNTTVRLGNGNDKIVVSGYNNIVQAGNGVDTVSGIQGNSTVHLGDGGDTVTAAGYSNQITTGAGNDTIVAGDGNAVVSSGAGNDTITLGGWSNWIDAGTGNNTLTFKSGGGSNTVVLHTAGTDQVFGYATTSGDVFDLRSVLTEAALSIGSSFTKLGTYLHVTNSGGNASLQFDATGAWTGSGSTLAVLHGVGTSVSSLTDLLSHNALRIA